MWQALVAGIFVIVVLVAANMAFEKLYKRIDPRFERMFNEHIRAIQTPVPNLVLVICHP